MADATMKPTPPSVRLEHLTAALAFDLAAQLSPLQVIMDRYGLTEAMLTTALQHPPFVKLIREAKAKWESDMSVAERVRLKAQFALEDCILPMHNIAHNKDAGNVSRIDAVKLIASIAGMSRGDAVQQESGKFSLTINMGGDKPPTTLTIAAPTVDQAP